MRTTVDVDLGRHAGLHLQVADVLDRPGVGQDQPYYSVLILADAESVKEVGDLKMQAGMPAEVYIDGGTQTPLQYLAEPITTTLRRAGRQM